MIITILAVGDVCGEPGLSFLNNRLKAYREERGIDFVVVNGDLDTAAAQLAAVFRAVRLRTANIRGELFP